MNPPFIHPFGAVPKDSLYLLTTKSLNDLLLCFEKRHLESFLYVSLLGSQFT